MPPSSTTLTLLATDMCSRMHTYTSPKKLYADAGLDTDKDGNHDQLRFPPFHTEVLTQTWASPAQDMGRIKIVITEGINHGPGVSAFERTKNLVSFSFQHAPLREVEFKHFKLLMLTFCRYTGELWHRLAKPRIVLSGCAAIPPRIVASHASSRSGYACPFSTPPECITGQYPCKAQSSNRPITESGTRISSSWTPR